MRRLLRAVRLARREFSNALYWPDWEQRRVLFEAHDLFDALAHDPEHRKRSEDAYYLVGDLLNALNDRRLQPTDPSDQ